MQVQKILTIEKLLLGALLIGSVAGFWYFEPSVLLRITVLALSAIGVYIAFFGKTNENYSSSQKELIILLILYLGLFSIYNFLYGLSLPVYIIMIAILIIASLSFFILLSLDYIDTLIKKSVFYLYIVTMGLIILETFLALSFWPVDPKVKSLIIVSVFYLLTNLIYLSAAGMLRFKKAIGFIVVTVVIIAVLVFKSLIS